MTDIYMPQIWGTGLTGSPSLMELAKWYEKNYVMIYKALVFYVRFQEALPVLENMVWRGINELPRPSDKCDTLDVIVRNERGTCDCGHFDLDDRQYFGEYNFKPVEWVCIPDDTISKLIKEWQ